MQDILLDGLAGNLAIFLGGALLIVPFGRRVGTRPSRAIAIYLWHTAFALLYIVVLQDIGGDAFGYFQKAMAGEGDWRPGAGLVISATRLLTVQLGLSFTAVSLVFACFGAVGLLLVDSAIRRAAAFKPRWIRVVASLIVFLPSASFWSAGLGKDSLAMLATGMFLMAALPGVRQGVLLAAAACLMFLVRPHIGVLMLAAAVVDAVAGRGSSWSRRAVVAGGAALAIAATAPLVQAYVGLDGNVSQAAIEEIVSRRQGLNLAGGSSLDIEALNPASRLFVYLFGPTIFSGPAGLALVPAIENSLLLVALATGLIFGLMKRGDRAYQLRTLMLLVFAAAALLVLSQTTANLGIAVRQKWMILPALLLLGIHWMPDRPGLRPSARHASTK